MIQNNVHYIELSKFNEVCGNLEKQISELQEKLKERIGEIDTLEAEIDIVRDKLHRRNLLIRSKDEKIKKLEVLLGYFSPKEISEAKTRMNRSNINYNG